MRKVRISLCQFEVEPHPSFEHFTAKVMSMMEQVPTDSHYVVFPELFTLGLVRSLADYPNVKLEQLGQIAMFQDSFIAFFSKLAKERKQVIIAGSTFNRVDNELYNTCYVFDDNGSYTHSKTHLFPPEAACGTLEGNLFSVLDIGPARIATSICYEMQIPEIATILADQGVEIIFCPSHTSEYGYHRVSYCAKARAVENQIYVAVCPTLGNPVHPSLEGHGKAAIYSPCDTPLPFDGVIAEAEMDKPMVVSGEVDLDLLKQLREHGTTRTYQDRIRRRNLYKKYAPFN